MKTIFLVKNNIRVQTLLRANLERAGYYVECVNSDTILSRLNTSLPDLIILDISLFESIETDFIARYEQIVTSILPLIIINPPNKILDNPAAWKKIGLKKCFTEPFNIMAFVASIKQILGDVPKDIVPQWIDIF